VTDSRPEMPVYKGEPLDPERGPGLGCFWFQVILLGFLLVLTPLTVTWQWPTWISATLLIVTLILLLFAGQTVIFLLRLVAADRRTRRRPQAATAHKTVGMLEDEAAAGATEAGAAGAAETGAAVDTETGAAARSPDDAAVAEDSPPD
jgi:hypothetical protein